MARRWIGCSGINSFAILALLDHRKCATVDICKGGELFSVLRNTQRQRDMQSRALHTLLNVKYTSSATVLRFRDPESPNCARDVVVQRTANQDSSRNLLYESGRRIRASSTMTHLYCCLLIGRAYESRQHSTRYQHKAIKKTHLFTIEA